MGLHYHKRRKTPFPCEARQNDEVGGNASGIAVGHDGTIYVAAVFPTSLYAVTSEGESLWEYPVNNGLEKPPIVAGDGTIYLVDKGFGGGYVHAINPDGTPKWVHQLPQNLHTSPMLAPDGTLYVMCEDELLYAFQDPSKGDVSLNDIIDGRDIRFFIRVLFGVDDDEFRVFAADLNSDGVVDVNDVPLFVDTLLSIDN